MEYKFNGPDGIEKKWQDEWKKKNRYKVENDFSKPKYYVLDMFPYPSGAGLHVGHPLGYIASDIFSRYKRLKGFNVLHPMGFDSFGLPAEQYAIETGQHPAETTKKNIATFKAQLDKIGFCYDWDREVRTSDPAYYKWTQWIFLQLFNSYYDTTANKATPIAELIKQFENEGNLPPSTSSLQLFTADEWKGFTKQQQEEILMNRRLAFSKYGEVNWCEALGTVLANDEVVNGVSDGKSALVSERGSHLVVKKKMRQWYLRITDYADRLLEGLETVNFSDSMKEMQRNWIGKSVGAEITFPLSISPRRGEEMEEMNAENSEEINGEIKGNSDELKKSTAEKISTAGGSSPLQGEAGVRVPGHGYAEYSVKSPMNFKNAKENRKNPTEAEKILWDALRARAIGYKFRRQHPIENYIADFICLDVWLAIEIDGGYHNDLEQKAADEQRDNRLKQIGFTTLRFTNEEVLHNIDAVLKLIKEKADELKNSTAEKISAAGGSSPLQGEAGVRVYTTRPDTIFGVDFMVVAPELELIKSITTDAQKDAVEEYIAYVKSRSDVDRMAEKKITGCFTGAYAINPFDGREIPIWISEYVLAGYGTGAIMAVPCGDERDFKFAKHFNIPITNIIGSYYNGEEANPTKEAILENSGFINGMKMMDASEVVLQKLESEGSGKRKVNYKMRDAGFSRQRYWGEPFPIIWSDGIAIPLDADELPLELPHVDKYGPGPEGEGPLANLKEWTSSPALLHTVEKGDYGKNLAKNEAKLVRETSTMPGYAGSSWYFLRYMDPNNTETFCDRKASDYWNQVDLYIGGTEHAVGHLLYSRLWTKVLYDLGYIGFDEPFKKLVNQGMIQGSSRFVYRISVMAIIGEKSSAVVSSNEKDDIVYVSNSFLEKYRTKEISSSELLKLINSQKIVFEDIEDDVEYGILIFPIHVNVELVDGSELDVEKYKESKPELANAIFILDNGKYICGAETEKMSKSKYNTVNPDELCNKYGADTFRMYEMFLGPVEQSKPWDTKGIEGVHRFLRKLWRLFFDEIKGKVWTTEKATDAELKVLHRTIKKIEEDTERFSFNTAVSTFMICVNELADIKCHKKEVLEQLLILLTPYAPHIAEELWHQLGNESTILDATYPTFNPALLVESSKEYPVSINGKVRTNINLALDLQQADVEKMVLQNDVVQKWLEGKAPKKIIYVKNKMVNVVI